MMPKVSVPPPPVDPDAQAFITATGITDITQQNAINQLVLDLKSASIWTKMKAVYPIVGGTAFTHKFNLINPLDTNAAFRLTFNGGWTHSPTGMLPNGINAYATTYIIPATHLLPASKHLSYYSRTSATTINFSTAIGCDNSSDGFCRFTIRQTVSGDPDYSDSLYGNSTNGNFVTSNTDGKGFYNNTRLNADNKFFKNGVALTGTSSSLGTSSQASVPIYIGAARSSGVTAYYDNKECAFASIGDGLTDTDAANFYNIVQNYQTTLGRDV
jgi:hypothetical protein